MKIIGLYFAVQPNNHQEEWLFFAFLFFLTLVINGEFGIKPLAEKESMVLKAQNGVAILSFFMTNYFRTAMYVEIYY
ncbi:hypothetical protein [Pseudanabaena sp. BC1403]|uniref:hypothetical protein n=1 Tax=Pseudanabaena sp. BC1403 TaxID=2043171 RepID=UPI000CD7F8D9|nr:hypothetical protein [Pseudanabaena sp. BC1403]